MKQQQFEYLHQSRWRQFQTLLEKVSGKKRQAGSKRRKKQSQLGDDYQNSLQNFDNDLNTDLNHTSMNDISSTQNNIQSTLTSGEDSLNNNNNTDNEYEFISLYRLICQHYSLAKQRHYSPQLVGYLHDMVIAGHHQLYRRQGNLWSRIYHFYAYTFPVRFREHIGLFWLSFVCFTVPLIIFGLACYFNQDMLYTIMPADNVREMESMYDPSNRMIGRDSERRSDTDMVMFGYYIMNNVGIDFRIYGMGLFAGVGTLISILYNGIVIGGVAGHLTGIGFGETFWQFVVGHGSFELTAAVISGAAGLRLAQSLFMPGNYSRGDAFKIAGKQSIEILMGAATMTFIAAFIEAFWSSSSVISPTIKYLVGLFLWVIVIGYLMYAGRKHSEDMEVRHAD